MALGASRHTIGANACQGLFHISTRFCLHRHHDLIGGSQDHVWCERDQIHRLFANPVHISRTPAEINTQVTTYGPPRLLHPLQECCETRLTLGVLSGEVQKHADAPHLVALLRACGQWPCRGCAAEHLDELPAPHSITSSARASSVGGTSMPSAVAVIRLITRSYLVGC